MALQLQKCQKEGEDFKKERILGTNKCPLKWWKKNKEKYEILAVLARQFLAAPATSAPSERLFIAGPPKSFQVNKPI